MHFDKIGFWADVNRSDATGRTFSVDYSGLRVHRTLPGMLIGKAGYRPILLMLAAVLLVLIVLMPVPDSLVALVERVDPPGYDLLEADTRTIADSVNYHRNPEPSKHGSWVVGLPTQRRAWIPANRLPGWLWSWWAYSSWPPSSGGPKHCL